MIYRILNGHGLGSSPENIQDIYFIDKIYFTAKGSLSAGRNIDNTSEQWDIFRFQRVSPGAKHIQCLPVPKQYRSLGFMYNQLAGGVEILRRVLPYENFVCIRSFVFDYFYDIHS
jgi:hypothetical protein